MQDSNVARVFNMFDKYSEKARRAIFFARYEASQFGSPSIDTEHLLLGILRESRWLEHFLGTLGLDRIKDRIRQEVPIREKISTSVDLPFSEQAERVLRDAAEEAERCHERRVAPEHLLLGLLRQEQCLSRKVMEEAGVELEAARDEVALWLEGKGQSHDLTAGLQGRSTGMPVPNADFNRAITDAIGEAGRLYSTTARPEHLLLGLLLNERSLAARILHEAGLNLASVRESLRKQQ